MFCSRAAIAGNLRGVGPSPSSDQVVSGLENLVIAGLGGLMMDFVETDLAQRRYRFATLNVARDNPAAYRFYYRRHYRVTAPEPGQWSYLDHRGVRRFVDEPALRMEKQLPAAG